jgi:hypothetical protein
MCQPIGSFEKCVCMYAEEHQTPVISNHGQNPGIETHVTVFHG